MTKTEEQTVALLRATAKEIGTWVQWVADFPHTPAGAVVVRKKMLEHRAKLLEAQADAIEGRSYG